MYDPPRSMTKSEWKMVSRRLRFTQARLRFAFIAGYQSIYIPSADEVLILLRHGY